MTRLADRTGPAEQPIERVRIGRVQIEAASPLVARRLADALGPALERRLAGIEPARPVSSNLAERAASAIVAAIDRATGAGQ